MKKIAFVLLLFLYSIINFAQTYQANEFVTTWKTDNAGSSNSTSITIPAPNPSSHSYNYEVDWDNDGVFDQTGITGTVTHDFSAVGTYTIRIRGTFPIIRFNNTGDKLKITDIVQWGNNPWTSMYKSFYGCENLTITATDAPELANVTNMKYMFRNAFVLNSNINHWNVSNVINMKGLFFSAKVFNQPLNNWTTTNVANMQQMFYKAYVFNSPLFSDVGSVTNMAHMFRDARKFNQDIGAWDVSQVTTMYFMFANAYEFNQNIGGWTTSSLTNMNNIFSSALVFNQNINNWDVSGLTSLNGAFKNAFAFDQPLGQWNVSNVTSMIGMLEGVTLSTVNYDDLLIGWNALTLKPNVNFHGGNSKYCMGKAARENMIANDGWTITDLGYSCDDCSGKVLTWNGTNWLDVDANIITPDDLTPVTLTANYDTSTNGNFDSCNCTINSGITLTVNEEDYVSVTKDLINNGNIIIDNKGSFIQTSENATITTGANGTYKAHKTTRPYVEYDYNYWSSPTIGETVENAFQTNSTLSAGTSDNSNNATQNGRMYWLNTANFNDSNGDTFDDEQDAWTPASGTMTPGKGYIAMGAGADFPFNTTFSTGLEQSVFFEGEFNNTDITIPVVSDNDSGDTSINENLIGNPYPSAIDIKKLMLENSTILAGTFYFWTHDSPINSSNSGSEAYNFTNADYAIATTDGSSFNAVSGGTNGTAAPEFIASCQGFIVKVDNPGDLKFTNSMRVKGSNNNFKSNTTINSNENKFHLNLTNNHGLFRQILIGFNENAIDGVDKLDGVRNLRLETNFYSIIDNSDDNYAIQLLNEFDESKTIPLGVDISSTGNYQISLANIEGIFANSQNVYLEDLLTNTIHNLSNDNYSFFIEEGVDIENRFLLRFNNSSLSIDDNITLFKPVVYPNPSNGRFNITFNTNENVEIKIFDITGKKIFYKEITNTSYALDLTKMEKGVYFMELFDQKNKVIKKLIIN